MAPNFGCAAGPLKGAEDHMKASETEYSETISKASKPKDKPFEVVQEGQYQANQKCVSFGTSHARALGWMCALCARYYDELGQDPRYIVKWNNNDSPKKRDGVITEVLISIQKKPTEEGGEPVKLVTLKYFLTTLTIMAQGNAVPDFIYGEFPALKATVDSLYDTTERMTTCVTRSPEQEENIEETLVKSVIDTEETIIVKPPDDDVTDQQEIQIDQSVASDTVSKVKDTTDEEVKDHGKVNSHCTASTTQLQMSASQTQQVSKSLEQIAFCLTQMSDVKHAIHNLESTFMSEILNVRDENLQLKLELAEKNLNSEHDKNKQLHNEIKSLRQELNNVKTTKQSLIPCNHDDEITKLKSEIKNLDESNRNLKGLALVSEEKITKMESQHKEQVTWLENSRHKIMKDCEKAETRANEKSDITDMLDGKYKKIAKRLDEATDELLTWRLHDQRERVTATRPCICNMNTDGSRNKDTKSVPNKDVLFIGTSLTQGIKPDKLLQGYQTDLVTKYRVADAAAYIDEYSKPPPAAVVFQQMSNNIKDSSTTAQQCADELAKLVEKTIAKFPASKIILSLPPGRGDPDLHLKTLTANVTVKQKFYKTKNVAICDNSCLLENDTPTSTFFNDDLLHLNNAGTSKLAANIKTVLCKSLDIEVRKQERYNKNGPSPTYNRERFTNSRKQGWYGQSRNYQQQTNGRENQQWRGQANMRNQRDDYNRKWQDDSNNRHLENY